MPSLVNTSCVDRGLTAGPIPSGRGMGVVAACQRPVVAYPVSRQDLFSSIAHSIHGVPTLHMDTEERVLAVLAGQLFRPPRRRCGLGHGTRHCQLSKKGCRIFCVAATFSSKARVLCGRHDCDVFHLHCRHRGEWCAWFARFTLSTPLPCETRLKLLHNESDPDSSMGCCADTSTTGCSTGSNRRHD